jgi:hypothetical protein
MGQITANLERSYCRVVRGTCKLVAAADDADAATLALIRDCFKWREKRFDVLEDLFALHFSRY